MQVTVMERIEGAAEDGAVSSLYQVALLGKEGA